MGIFSVFSSKKQHEDLDKGLEKTRANVFSKISKAVVGKSKVDDEVLDNSYKQVSFARVVDIYGASGNTGRSGNFRNCSSSITFPGKDFHRCLQDLFLAG